MVVSILETTTSTHLKIIADLHAEEFVHFAADKVDFFGFQAKEHRQAQQAIAFAGSVFIFAAKAAIAQARRRAMQRHIVEYRQNAVVYQVLKECRTRLQVFNLQVKHMRIVLTMFRNERQLDQALVG